MRFIYHIVSKSVWEQARADAYRAASLDTDGFIHCSNRDQVARVANRFYGDQRDLLVLCIDVDRLSSPLRDEDDGTGERYPHVYEPIPREAIVELRALERDGGGRWVVPDRPL